MAIHKFKYKDEYVLLDVNSSIIFLIDELIYHILDYYPAYSQSEAIVALKSRYPQKMIMEGLSEIDSLICSGKLFTKDTYNKTDVLKDDTIKAMCLHISHDCNMSCMYCFASGGDFNTKEKLLMSFDTAKTAVDLLINNSANHRNLEVDFFGGEPLMNFEVVRQTVEYAESLEEKFNKKFRFTITTNAMLLNDEIMDFVNAHMSNIVLSIDGRKEVQDRARHTLNEKGTYDIVMPNIMNAVKRRKDGDYFVRGTFTSENLDFSEDVKHLADLGCKNLSVEPVVALDGMDYAIRPEHLDQIFKEYDKLTELYLSRKKTSKSFNFFHFNIDLNHSTCQKKKVSGCGAGCNYIAVTPQGDIFPCHQFVGEDVFKMGNIFDGNMDAEIIQQFKETSLLSSPDCMKCWAKYFCGGGCHANAYHFTNNLSGCYKIGCEMQKKRIECALYAKCVEK